MTVTAPPRPPAPPELHTPDDLEALIEEARRRARKRRLRNAAAAVAIAAILLTVFSAQRLGQGGSAARVAAAAPLPKPLPARPLPANGGIAVVTDNALVEITLDGYYKQLLARCPGPSSDCAFGHFAWSPNGRYVAFLAGHFGGALTRNNLSLYVADTKGSAPRRLARCGGCEASQGNEVSWAPDSRRIVLAADDALYVVDVVTGESTRLRSDVRGTSVAWSPEGSRIAVADGGSLSVVTPSGRSLGSVAADGAADPTWSPDGTKIAFDGANELYSVDANGSHLKVLLYGSPGSGPGTPSWSPDGRRILYFYTPGSPENFTGQVWSMQPDGSHRQRLYDEGCCVGDWHPPIWSPDGRWVALSGATETDGVVVMKSDGTHRRQLLGLPSAIAWQPLPRR
jgi:hypothetical protein